MNKSKKLFIINTLVKSIGQNETKIYQRKSQRSGHAYLIIIKRANRSESLQLFLAKRIAPRSEPYPATRVVARSALNNRI